MAIAYDLGWEVAGIDRHKPYVEAAGELLPEATVWLSEISDLDELEADFIYMYRPAIDEEIQVELESHILSLASPGQVHFWPTRHIPEVWVT